MQNNSTEKLNLQEFFAKRQKALAELPQHREFCVNCRQPIFGCYCAQVQAFDPNISFVILIHPIEVKRRIATGRMSHQCLKGSFLVEGQNFTNHELVNNLLQDQAYRSVLLYPGKNSLNISQLTKNEVAEHFSSSKKLRIFVLDGTWATAKKQLYQSQNLNCLPKISFSPVHPSTFRVRKQPAPNCFSTIEAIHYTIEVLGQSQGFAIDTREHDKLLHVFNSMVERQLSFIRHKRQQNSDNACYRREHRRSL